MKSSAIKVGNRIYSIVGLDDELFDIVLAQHRVYDNGIKSFIDYDEQMVIVRNRLQPDHQQELIIHELIHACIEDSGVEQDEKFVAVLAPRLSSLLSSGLEKVLLDLR